MVVGAAAMILGLTGFLYLHSKKQIDFYNSLPVKREMLFAVKFLDGFLIILAGLPDQHVCGVWNFLRKRDRGGRSFQDDVCFLCGQYDRISPDLCGDGDRGASHRESLYLDPRRRRPVRIFAGGLPADRGLKIPVLCDTGKRRRCVLACKIRFPLGYFTKLAGAGA